MDLHRKHFHFIALPNPESDLSCAYLMLTVVAGGQGALHSVTVSSLCRHEPNMPSCIHRDWPGEPGLLGHAGLGRYSKPTHSGRDGLHHNGECAHNFSTKNQFWGWRDVSFGLDVFFYEVRIEVMLVAHKGTKIRPIVLKESCNFKTCERWVKIWMLYKDFFKKNKQWTETKKKGNEPIARAQNVLKMVVGLLPCQ